MSIDLEKLLGKAIGLTHKEQPDKMQTKLADEYASTYGEAVNEGYGKSAFEVEWESPDRKMIQHLQSNVYEFSHAKTHEQLKALTAALYDKDGNIIPYNEFKEIAGRINNEMAIRHLQAEYNTAIGSAQVAARWTEFEAMKDIYPNLMYDTAGDKRVRPSHAALDGVVKPMDDDFWDRNTPPLAWNCRCTIRQATGGRAITPADKIAEPDDTPPLFKKNFAKGGMAFPPEHPYFKNLPEDIKVIAKKGNPYNYTKIYNSENGGYVYNSTMSRAAAHELEMAQSLADNGRKVIYLPDINPHSSAQKKLREMALPKEVAKTSKNVDAMVDGVLFEFKKATRNTIADRIEEAFGKCSRLVIKTEELTKRNLKNYIEDYMNKNPDVKVEEVIWINSDNEVVTIL